MFKELGWNTYVLAAVCYWTADDLSEAWVESDDPERKKYLKREGDEFYRMHKQLLERVEEPLQCKVLMDSCLGLIDLFGRGMHRD